MSKNRSTVASNGNVAASIPPPGDERPAKNTPLEQGTPAPNFTLTSSLQPRVSLDDFRGRPLIMAFYPADWSPVCTDQLAIYQQLMPEWQKHNAQLLGISVDSVWCHYAWAKERHLTFPLLSDFEPKGRISRDYHAYRLPEGVDERALYVIDGDGRIFWSYISPISVNPGADGILNALEQLAQREHELDNAHRTRSKENAT